MRTAMKGDREYTIYDSQEEASEVAYSPPKYCEKCGNILIYCSFYDSSDRFTVKAYCQQCRRNWAVPLRQEKYEEGKLKRWEKAVKERAGYQCEMIDDKCSGDLHAHHIIPKHLDPSKKYDITNGMCLCAAHHKMIHHYM